MKFIQIIGQKKFALISIFLFLYVMINLLEGERGLVSFYAKKKIKDQLVQEKSILIKQLISVEKKTSECC